MTLQQMEYIVAVYRLRHFAKAAEQCGVTQPTLSAMIQKMETELGVKIFERSSQQVVPTNIGKLIVEQAWRVLARAKKIKDIVEEERQTLKGLFRIGILPTIAPYLLPRFFPKLTADFPDVDFRVMEMKTEACKRALARGELDAAILVSLDDMDNYNQTSLFFVQILYFVPFLWILMASNMMALTHRMFWATVLGLVMPYWFAVGYYVVTNQFDAFIDHFAELAQFEPLLQYEALDIHRIATFGLVVLLAVIGIIHYMRNSYQDKIRTRMIFEMFITVDILSFVFIILQPQHFDNLLPHVG